MNKEVKYKNSRFDLVLKCKINTFIEAKCVTAVNNGLAKFPDSPTLRGRKHVLELMEAIEHGFDSTIVFVIQREDAKKFVTNYIMDPKFYETLKLAVKQNVKIIAIKCQVNRMNIKLWKRIKVEL